MAGSSIRGSTWRVAVAALLIFGLLLFAARLGQDVDHSAGTERTAGAPKRP